MLNFRKPFFPPFKLGNLVKLSKIKIYNKWECVFLTYIKILMVSYHVWSMSVGPSEKLIACERRQGAFELKAYNDATCHWLEASG